MHGCDIEINWLFIFFLIYFSILYLVKLKCKWLVLISNCPGYGVGFVVAAIFTV